MPSLRDIAQLIAALAATGALGVSIYAAAKVKEVAKEVNEVHLTVNSRMTQLLEVTERLGVAAGVRKERNKQKE